MLLEDAVLVLQLPIEAVAVSAAANAILAGAPADVDEDVLTDTILEDFVIWVSGGQASPHLVSAFSAALSAGSQVDWIATGSEYFDVLAALERGGDKFPGLTRGQARLLLSRVGLVEHLLGEGASSTQVARLLRSWESSLDVPWASIRLIARRCELLPQLTNAFEQLEWNRDEARAEDLFPDGDANEACAIAGELGALAWESEGDLAELLRGLIPSDSDSLTYLQILSFALLPVECFDHPPSWVYEFSPRGQVANTRFSRFQVATSNPILNNAKAVQSLDRVWGQSRGGVAAQSLVSLLQALDALPYAPRRALCRVLRAWVRRMMDLTSSALTQLSTLVSETQVDSVLRGVASGESGTGGVLEQRVADAYVAARFASDRVIGVGDAANASNWSRRKLGDLEVLSPFERRSIAIEIHAGRLTSMYVQGHMHSLGRSLKRRLDESWRSIAPASEWRVEVMFVAHEVAVDAGAFSNVIHDVEITVSSITYEDFFGEWRGGALLDSFNSILVPQVNSRNTREIVRRILADSMK